jgi:hypothetical protein
VPAISGRQSHFRRLVYVGRGALLEARAGLKGVKCVGETAGDPPGDTGYYSDGEQSRRKDPTAHTNSW